MTKPFAPPRAALALFLVALAACDMSGPTRPGLRWRPDVVRDLVRRAAEQGDAGAQTSLGTWYETGDYGLPRRPEEALRLYGLAAGQGNPIAMTNLAVLYARGRDVAQDDAAAVGLLKRAAATGDPRARLYLAGFLADGRGGLAADDPEALAALDEVAVRELAEGCLHRPIALAVSHAAETGAGGGAPDLDRAIRFAECALTERPFDRALRESRDVEDIRRRRALEKEIARLDRLKARRDGSRDAKSAAAARSGP